MQDLISRSEQKHLIFSLFLLFFSNPSLCSDPCPPWWLLLQRRIWTHGWWCYSVCWASLAWVSSSGQQFTSISRTATNEDLISLSITLWHFLKWWDEKQGRILLSTFLCLEVLKRIFSNLALCAFICLYIDLLSLAIYILIYVFLYGLCNLLWRILCFAFYGIYFCFSMHLCFWFC